MPSPYRFDTCRFFSTGVDFIDVAIEHCGMSTTSSSTSCPHLSGYNPLAPDELRDPYPTYAVAREHAPVFRADAMGLWFITRYEDVAIALRDTETFSSQMAGETLADGVPASLRHELDQALAAGVPDDSRFLAITDAPAHNVRRKLAQQAFTPRRVAALERVIQARTEELCDGFGTAERVELMSTFSYPLTTSVIAGIIGLGEAHAAQMRAVSEDLLVVNSPGGRQLDEAEAEDVIARITRISDLHTAIAFELAARREAPRDDLLSALATSTLNDGTQLDDEDILAITAELILAGTDTTANLIAHAVLFISPDHERWPQLAEDDDLTHAVVEETLRRRGSSKGLFRITTRDVEIGGTVIPQGAIVQLLYGSANHDPAQFPDPETFTLDRPGIDRHVAFGRGTHFCLGAPLARLETRVALQTLSRRFPGLAVPPQELTYIPAMSTHTVATFTVTTEAREPVAST
jgi:cytochrome P450